MSAIKEAITEADLKFWIQLGGIVATMAVGWALLSAKVEANASQINTLQTALERQQTECRETHEKINLQMTEIQVALANIQKDIIYIRKEIDR